MSTKAKIFTYSVTFQWLKTDFLVSGTTASCDLHLRLNPETLLLTYSNIEKGVCTDREVRHEGAHPL